MNYLVLSQDELEDVRKQMTAKLEKVEARVDEPCYVQSVKSDEVIKILE